MIVALTLSTNSSGSRLIRILRADLRNQTVPGTFDAIVHCLVVLRSIQGKAPADEVPRVVAKVSTCKIVLMR